MATDGLEMQQLSDASGNLVVLESKDIGDVLYFEYDKKLKHDQATERVNCVARTADHIIAGYDDGSLVLWLKGKRESPVIWRTSSYAAINCIVATPNAFYAACDDKQIHVLHKGNDVWKTEKWVGHTSWVYSLALDDGLLFSGSFDGTICVWKQKQGYDPLSSQIQEDTVIPIFKVQGAHNGCIDSLRVKDGFLYSGSSDGKIRKWQKKNLIPFDPSTVNGLEVVNEWTAIGKITSIFVTNKFLYASCFNSEEAKEKRRRTSFPLSLIQIWDLSNESGKSPKTIKCYNGFIYDIHVTRDRIFGLISEGSIYVWNATTREMCQSIKRRVGFQNNITSMCIAEGENNKIGIYSGGLDGKLQIWRPIPAHYVTKYTRHVQPVVDVAVDQKYIYTASVDKTVRVWSKSTIKKIKSEVKILGGHTKAVNCLCFDNDRLYSGSSDKTIRIYDKKTFETIAVLEPDPDNYHFDRKKRDELSYRRRGHENSVTCIAVDEGRIYSGSHYEVLVWDKASLEIVRILQVPDNQVNKNTADLDFVEQKVADVKVYKGWIYVIQGSYLHLYYKVEPIRSDNISKTTQQIEPYSFRLKASKAAFSNIEFPKNYNEKEDDGELFEGGDEVLNCLFIQDNLIFAGGTSGAYVWRDSDQNVKKEVYPKPARASRIELKDQRQEVRSIFVEPGFRGRVFCAVDSNIYVVLKDQILKNGSYLSDIAQQVIPDPSSYAAGNNWIYKLELEESKLYTGSFDKSLGIWKLESFQTPNFFKMCRADDTISDNIADLKSLIKLKDSYKRTALMACAQYGTLSNARRLVEVGAQWEHVSTSGQSALFFALRDERWDFIKGMQRWRKNELSLLDTLKADELSVQARKKPTILQNSADMLKKSVGSRDSIIRTPKEARKKQMEIESEENVYRCEMKVDKKDTCSRELLRNRAAAGDAEFFRKLIALEIEFDKEEVIAEAIKYNQTWFTEHPFWTIFKHALPLHYAFFYGQPDCVKSICKCPDVEINQYALASAIPQPVNNYQATPLHWCHRGLQYSEYASGDLSLETMPPDVFKRLEADLILRRSECFKNVIAMENAGKKPNPLIADSTGFSVYEESLRLHDYVLDQMKKPLREIEDSNQIKNNEKMFEATVQHLEFYEQMSSVAYRRGKYAIQKFCRKALLYIMFLALLTLTGFWYSSNGLSDEYYFSEAVKFHLLGPDFEDIRTEDDFWGWFSGPFLTTALDPGENGDPSGFVLDYNKLVGSIRLKQHKVKNDTCVTDRNLFKDTIDFCFNARFSVPIEDRDPFGPDLQYVYTDDEGGTSFWGADDQWYPTGGFVEDFGNNNFTEALLHVASLRENEWITRGTRMVLVSFSLYNPNLGGSFAINRLAFKFTAAGDVTPSSEIVILSPFAYDRDITPVGYAKLVVEVIIIIFVCYEFLFTEISEIRQYIRASHARRTQIKKLATAQYLSNPTLSGLREYFSMSKNAWNYYEWLIIIVFLNIVWLRIYSIVYFGKIDLDNLDIYVNFQTAAFAVSYGKDLLALFALLCWLRLQKFFRTLPFTGPLIQSIHSTLQSRSVIVFFLLLAFYIISFAFAFHFSFGFDVLNYRTYQNSFLTLFLYLFADPDYEEVSGMKIFGPLFFTFYMLMCVLILTNLLIGILGNAYESVQDLNEIRWNRYITRLMISTLKSRVANYMQQIPFWRRALQSVRRPFRRATTFADLERDEPAKINLLAPESTDAAHLPSPPSRIRALFIILKNKLLGITDDRNKVDDLYDLFFITDKERGKLLFFTDDELDDKAINIVQKLREHNVNEELENLKAEIASLQNQLTKSNQS